ncbi:MAG: anthranilate phosphoribosyltransferase [Proteobacteria bacterium]|nr:anthranilate phosphoribosyltransferase [Pseudomonadota bacterium]
MSLQEAIATAASGAPVPEPVLTRAFSEIVSGEASAVRIAALLVALRTKGETVGEIVAIARVLRDHSSKAPLPDPKTVDTCGTGGDGADTFNISTAAAFVVAGAGTPVAKHGNRAASSQTGSFDVLEKLGIRIDLPIEVCGRILAEVGIAPFFARTAHPAMRHVAPVRGELGIRTLMNALGPLLNPVGVKRQLIGVYSRSLVEPLAAALGALGAERALVVHGSDGLDELTTTGPSHGALWRDGIVESLEVDPQALGLTLARAEELRGGDPAHNAELIEAVLSGASGPPRDIVALNAAGALYAAGAVESLGDGLARACESIDSGAAAEKLAALRRATQAAGESA